MTLRSRPGFIIEWMLATCVVAGIVYTIIFAISNNYLPQPFFYEPDDTWADWFNTSYWARDPGSYDVWSTLYPPLSFVILRMLGIGSCYIQGRAFESSPGLAARSCDWLGVASIWFFFFLGVVLTYLALRKIDGKTALPRTIAVGLGFPFLDALERGNLMLISFPFFILATSSILFSARLRWLFAALAINLKVYLIAAFVPLVLRRKWRWTESVVIATVLVYLASFAIMGRGTLPEIVQNLSLWSAMQITQPQDVWAFSTYNGLISLMQSDRYPMAAFIGSRNVELLVFLIPAIIRSVQALILCAAVAIWLRPETIETHRVFNLGLLLAMITSEAGIYTLAYFSFLVMMEPWRGPARKWMIIATYALAIPIDFSIQRFPPIMRDTFLNHSSTEVVYHLTLLPFIRPMVVLSIALALSLSIIATVWRDIRTQGWADRWRFRRDAPILPWIRRPQPLAPPGAEAAQS